MAVDHLYGMTVKLFGSHAEPPFESASELDAVWGRNWGCNNDVGRLRTVLMHRPGDEFSIIDRSKRIESIGSFGDVQAGWYFQSDTIPELGAMQAQHDALVSALQAEDVDVVMLNEVSGHRFKSCYTRDSSFAINGGVIVCRMAPRMRRGEECTATQTLAALGIPILRTIHSNGLMEGGSFAWINSNNAVIGRSIRVNDEGIAQVTDVLQRQGVNVHVVDLCGYAIHIDGAFLMIDTDLALVNAAQLPYRFLCLLKELNIRTIEINPDDDPWIINGLAVAPGRVLMPPGLSANTREQLEQHHIDIIEIPYDAMHHNGGGIHCSTCPLIRDPIE